MDDGTADVSDIFRPTKITILVLEMYDDITIYFDLINKYIQNYSPRIQKSCVLVDAPSAVCFNPSQSQPPHPIDATLHVLPTVSSCIELHAPAPSGIYATLKFASLWPR